MIPWWLSALAFLSLAVACACAFVIFIDVVRRPQQLAIMNWVWPITALYAGPAAAWIYWSFGWPMSKVAMQQNRAEMQARPFWATIVIGTTHCGSGCVLGDIIAEFAIFLAGVSLGGFVLGAEYVGDFTLAYVFGIAFQYFAVVPIRGLPFWQGNRAAIIIDTLALTAFELGLFGWMAFIYFLPIHPHLNPSEPTYWFMMQIGMVIGFVTSYPVNDWLTRSGIKEAM